MSSILNKGFCPCVTQVVPTELWKQNSTMLPPHLKASGQLVNKLMAAITQSKKQLHLVRAILWHKKAYCLSGFYSSLVKNTGFSTEIENQVFRQLFSPLEVIPQSSLGVSDGIGALLQMTGTTGADCLVTSGCQSIEFKNSSCFYSNYKVLWWYLPYFF